MKESLNLNLSVQRGRGRLLGRRSEGFKPINLHGGIMNIFWNNILSKIEDGSKDGDYFDMSYPQ